MSINNADATQFKPIQNAALKLLARREHSYQELKLRLLKKHYPHTLVISVLDELVNERWLSDERFAEAYVRVRIQKGYGPVRIAYELEQRGVTKSIITATLQPFEQEWPEHAKNVWHKKFHKKANSPLEQQKQYAFLYYRGFKDEHIKICL